MILAIRNSIKIILLNNENQLLLIGIDDDSIRNKDGKYSGRFWHMIGGKVEEGEDMISAAKRELFEETGLLPSDVSFGEIVWYGKLTLMMNGVETLVKQKFIIAKTSKNLVTMKNLTPEEKIVAKELRWFPIDEIRNSNEIIYPIGLVEYLSDLLENGIPEKPIEIILDKKFE